MKRALGKFLCAIGMHLNVFYRYDRFGNFRPHFECKRRGCNYYNG